MATYTRKSLTEGLDQEFNTLEAQRDAVEGFIASRKAEGWVATAVRYDDGGFTGANTDRPAFQRLLTDVEEGRVDVVAVYKLDRLSRSLRDFLGLLDYFEARGVQFVAVTQNFDTTTSIGRLTMRLLATFGEFERETTSERTRDKVLAARRKGMWTGGRPVLGYDVVEKKLVVSECEAERVRAIFALYIECGSLLATVDELERRGWKAKTWVNKKGEVVRGRPLAKNALHHLITNTLYLGKVRCGDELYDGVHDAIVDPETWDRVQAKLASNVTGGPKRRPWKPRKNGALLAGLVRCGQCGASMTYHYTKRRDRRYGFYVCSRAQKRGAAACPGSRIAAGDLESFVVERIREIGRDPEVLAAVLEADREAREVSRPALVAEARKLGVERTRLETERGNLVDAITTGGQAAPALAERLGERDAELRSVQQREAALRAEIAALDTGSIDAEDLHEALADLTPIWAELFPAERARVLALLLERVEYDAAAGEVAITFRPGGPAALQNQSVGEAS